jgi:hypothetical protein
LLSAFMANTVSRYHLSHSPDVAGVCPFSEQRIQAPRDFNRDAPAARGSRKTVTVSTSPLIASAA